MPIKTRGQLGNYEVMALLGKDGMGDVYRTVKPGSTTRADAVARFASICR